MSRAPSNLGSDMDFVKEFEELRLKQKLLVETLSKKHKEKEKEALEEINSKLEFIVQIFQDSANEEEFNEKEYLDKHFKALTEKLDGVEKKFDDRMSNIEIKIQEIDELKKSLDEKFTNLETAAKEKEEAEGKEKEAEEKSKEENKEEVNTSESKTEEEKSKETEGKEKEAEEKPKEDSKENKDEPPMPDFSVDEDKISKLANEQGAEKKKGWF